MKRIGLVFLVSLILCITGYASGADTKRMVFVDLQKALNLSDAGKKAREAFSHKIEEAQKLLQTKQKELEKLKNSIEAKSLLLNEEARKKKEKEYQRELRDYQRFIRDSQEELKREEAEMSKGIIMELRKVVEMVGKKGNYTFIFEKTTSGVLYASDSVDLTEEVIKAYNEQGKTDD